MPSSVLFSDNLKKHEIEMNPNVYETVTRPQPAMQVHTEPCPAYMELFMLITEGWMYTHPVVLLQNRVRTPSLRKLGSNYKVYRHVVAPIRLLREVNYAYIRHHR